jgi:hypothetical protein
MLHTELFATLLIELSNFKCHWKQGLHEHVALCAEDEATLAEFHWSYRSRTNNAEDWTRWIRESLNNDSDDPLHSGDCGLSLDLVLGWSPIRISNVILGPVILSLVLGLWFQSRSPNDLVTIQTAWAIASYVATAGGCKS